ncbi:unnamed protein product [Musa hybrid cultivar]
MIEGMRMDLKKSRYKNFDELYLYCYYVAGTVGLMSVPVMGIAPESKATTESVYGAALALGLANQLTNILRDVGEEGRIYLPQDELAQAGLSDEDIFGGKVTEKWRSFMKNQIKRARMFFQQAEAGVTELNQASRWPVWASLQLYRQILDEIEANDYNNFTKRAYVSKAKKLLALPVAYGKSLISPSSLSHIDEGYVTFGDNNKGKIIGKGTIGNKSNFSIEDVLLVDGLKHNLLSISQLCDKGYIIRFESNACIIEKPYKNISMIALKQNNVYTIDINDLCNEMCFSALNEDAWIWHRRLGHASMKLITQISSKELVRGIPHIKFIKDNVCDACQLGSKYAFVIVDDYSRYTWTYFLKQKSECLRSFTKFCKLVQNEKGSMISSIRSDHGGEFQNHDFQEFCELNGYNHNFSTPRNPQQNGVVERKNRNLQEMARTMLNEHNLPKYFWAEAVNTACYILNRVLVRPLLTKTPYELWNNKKPNKHISLQRSLMPMVYTESCCVSFYLYLTVKMEGSGRGGGNADVVLQNYKLGKTLGIGSFGKVKIAEHLLSGHKVAIKILNRRKIKNMEMEEKVRREIKILRLFMHPHIIHLYEVIETQSDIYVVMEYVKSGELFDYIVEKGRLQEDEARRFFQQIISGVEYCHRNMVVHRDLKPENLLLDSKCDVKIADFGLSNVMRDGHFLKTSCGSPNYAAPEVISGKLYAGPEVDVWSCGVILYALLCGTLPFDDENIPNLFKKIKGGIYTLPSHLSALARDLIPRMLIVDPMKRITIREIREHPWFQTRLPRYLAVPPPDTIMQAKKIEEDILQEVIKMGFDKNQLVESLHNRIQNEATVSYYLLLDNRFRAMSGYLGGDFQETMDYGFSRMGASEAPAIAHHLPGYMDPPGIGLRPSVPVEKKWALGLQSRAHPREIMTEVLKALRELNVCWKKIGHYNMKCRYFSGISDHAESMFNDSLHANDSVSDESAIVESDNVSGKEFSTIKFEIQLYKTREEKYLLDLQRVSGPQLLFLDLCASFLAQLRVL